MPTEDGRESKRVVDQFAELASRIASGNASLPASLKGDEPGTGDERLSEANWDDDFSNFSDFDNNR